MTNACDGPRSETRRRELDRVRSVLRALSSSGRVTSVIWLVGSRLTEPESASSACVLTPYGARSPGAVREALGAGMGA